MSDWAVFELKDAAGDVFEIHICHCDDGNPAPGHTLSTACPCGPKPEPVDSKDGPVIVHKDLLHKDLR